VGELEYLNHLVLFRHPTETGDEPSEYLDPSDVAVRETVLEKVVRVEGGHLGLGLFGREGEGEVNDVRKALVDLKGLVELRVEGKGVRFRFGEGGGIIVDERGRTGCDGSSRVG
jgi:hypothetical protein